MMERRIRYIWMLSLLAMLILVAGQGYWLWNQYQYKNQELCDELYAKAQKTWMLCDSVRSLQPRPLFGPGKNSTHTSTSSSVRYQSDALNGAFSHPVRYLYGLQIAASDSCGHTIYCDSIQLKSTKDLGLMLTQAVKEYILEVDVPFTRQRMDSVLAMVLPGVPYRAHFYTQPLTDTLPEDSVWISGFRLRPSIHVRHAYSTLHGRMVEVTFRPALSALLGRMGGQLAGSLLMILLLALCFGWQICTILKQRRIEELHRSYTSTMIHELKRPVQALKMCVACLGEHTMRLDAQLMDQVVRDSVMELDTLSAYLQKLRDMTRADHDRLSLQLVRLDLREVVEAVAAACRRESEKPVEVELKMPLHYPVVADRMYLTNVLSNLMENAVKYSGCSVHIVVEAAEETKAFVIRIADNGIGIPTAEQSRVFDRFYRGSNLPDSSIPGIGLGLSYVKMVVEAHGGGVSLSSRMGSGTIVEIRLPKYVS